jgi:hypothetical protein
LARTKQPDYVIDIQLDEPSRSSPALGSVDKMLKQSLLETQSLQVVRHMLLRDMLERAQVTGVSKLTAAAGLRDGHRKALPPANGHGSNGKASYGSQAAEKVRLAKTAISGPRLNLFILEYLKDGQYHSGVEIMKAIKATGKGDHLNRLSGVFGLLSGEGFVKHTDNGYRITAPGLKFAPKLRSTLEASGQCVPGEYVAPSDYVGRSRRLGYKTMGQHMKLKTKRR